MKKIILTAATALALFSACNPKDTKLPRAKESEITANVKQFDQVFYEVFHNLTEELHSLMVIKDGKVIYEQYSTGHNAEEQHVLWSATKTFTALAAGFARQDGLLDVTDPVTKFCREGEIPAGRADSLSRIKIHNLLTMSSGLGDFDYVFDPMEDGTVNPVLSCLSSPIQVDPGTRFAYNNNDSHLAAICVSRAVGMKLRDYLDEKLFKPLGIRNYSWFEDPCGNNIGSFGLYMTTESIGKVALFILQRGKWNGKQLLEESWFDLQTTEQIFQGINNPDVKPEDIPVLHKENDWSAGYGYQMWMCKDGRGFRLDGANGQFGIVMPSKNAVAVLTAKCWNTVFELDSFWKNVYNEL